MSPRLTQKFYIYLCFIRYGMFSRSTSDRDLRTPGSESSRDRRSPVHRGHPSLDLERDRLVLSYFISWRTSLKLLVTDTASRQVAVAVIGISSLQGCDLVQ